MATLQTTQRLGLGERHVGRAVAACVGDGAIHADVFCLADRGGVGNGLWAGRVVRVGGHRDGVFGPMIDAVEW